MKTNGMASSINSKRALGNWSKLLYSNRTHLWGRRGVLKDTTYLWTLPTTFYWLLNLSWQRNIQLARVGITRQTRKGRFESHCNFLLLDRGVHGYAIKTPSFDVKQGGCSQTLPIILWFGGSCSSVVALTIYLIESHCRGKMRREIKSNAYQP